MQLHALGVPVSLEVLFFRRGFRGTWTWSTCDTLFCVLAEGRADLSDTGDMSDFVDRLSLKYLDTETAENWKLLLSAHFKMYSICCLVTTRGQCKSTTYVILHEVDLSIVCWCLQSYADPVLKLQLKCMQYFHGLKEFNVSLTRAVGWLTQQGHDLVLLFIRLYRQVGQVLLHLSGHLSIFVQLFSIEQWAATHSFLMGTSLHV